MRQTVSLFLSWFLVATPLCSMSAQTYPVPGPGRQAANTAVTFTGRKCGAYQGSSYITVLSCTLNVANAGDALVIYASGDSASGGWTATPSVTCGTAVLFRTITTFYSNVSTNLYYVPNASAGSCTVTVTPSQQLKYFPLLVIDVANANTTTPVDNTHCTLTPFCAAHGSSSSPSASIQTSGSNELVIGIYASIATGSTISSTGTFSGPVNNPASSTNAFGYIFESSSGTYTASYTASAGGEWEMQMVALTK